VIDFSFALFAMLAIALDIMGTEIKYCKNKKNPITFPPHLRIVCIDYVKYCLSAVSKVVINCG